MIESRRCFDGSLVAVPRGEDVVTVCSVEMLRRVSREIDAFNKKVSNLIGYDLLEQKCITKPISKAIEKWIQLVLICSHKLPCSKFISSDVGKGD